MQLVRRNGLLVSAQTSTIVEGDHDLRFLHPKRSTDPEGWFSIEVLADEVFDWILVDGEPGLGVTTFRPQLGGRVTRDAPAAGGLASGPPGVQVVAARGWRLTRREPSDLRVAA
jgi:hypothetical protein